jgi:hypothetical protein
VRTVFKGAFKFLVGVSWLAFCVPAFSARAPDAVERKITLTGQAALSFGELFGFASTAPSSDSMRLGRSTAWAVYLLKQDTTTQLWNDNEGSPARYDVVTFSPGPVPSITISPYWLDLATALPNTEAGAYELESPFVRDELPGSDPWTLLVKRLKASPGWSNAGSTPFDRCFTAPDRVELCMTVLRRDDCPANKRVSGYVVVIKAQVPDRQPSPTSEPPKLR